MTLALSPVRTVAPTTLPITLEEAKAHLNVVDDDNNALIEGLIRAATDYLDGYGGVLGKSIVTQTWRVDMTAWDEPLRIPLGPVQSIASITYYDALNASQTVAPADYTLLVDALGWYVQPVSGVAWPTVYGRTDAIRITFVNGSAVVSDAIKQIIFLYVGHWFANREAAVVGESVAPLPLAVEALLASKRIWFV